MNVNTDYKVREAIAKLAEMVEDAGKHGAPRRDEIEKRLETFAEAILEAAVDTATKKIKTANL